MKKRRFYKILSLVLTMLLTVALLPLTAFAEAGDWDPLTDPDDVLGDLVDTVTSNASTTVELGNEGYLRTMPTLNVGNYTYNASAYCGATARSNNTGIVEVKSIEIGSWQGGVWDGADALQVTVTPKSAGTTTVVINYYYTFSQHATPFNNPNAQWYYATLYYTVTVTGSTQPQNYSLSVVTSPAGGVTTGSGNYAANANVNISASAPQAPENSVYVFNGWTATAGTVASSNSESTTFTMPASQAVVTANYILKDDMNNNGTPDEEEDKFVVTYTDGVDGETVFADQVHSNLLYGSATPAFDGTPERENYVFAGWDPEVAETVTSSATYVAQWKADMNNNGTPDEEEGKYTITYTDGVDGVILFDDQVYTELLYGSATPAFEGTPERDGYVFAGWSPAVADTVTADITYTAQWEKEGSPTRPVIPVKPGDRPVVPSDPDDTGDVDKPTSTTDPDDNTNTETDQKPNPGMGSRGSSLLGIAVLLVSSAGVIGASLYNKKRTKK